MRHIGTALDIAASGERVWSLLTEFEHWPSWGISIRRVESAAARVATGVEGRVQTVAGLWLPFTIGDVTPGHFWAWEVAGIGATGHRVTPLADAECRAEFTAPWPAAPYLAVLRISLHRLKSLAEAT
ncbi:MAG: hypothetical protein HKN74_00645 [Acidimicrobiia bacterium]|nr:SRPBCC family protein [Acidimicrobiia bacterium]MBT8216941.1 SRPBCC family protein [Acidimicrobiia bacterium]NNF08779.1 hypothetical protein [Acidimicrobiia bacterium]NNL71367.1 hypothetical protein [Acidimicrobiia bacterium]